jgi:hypothetical protein
MDTLLRATNLLEVVNRVHQKVSASGPGDDQHEADSHEGGESPIDYSIMNRKRRLLQISPQPTVKTDYGSDGHSDDRSSSGSPDGNNPGYGSSSPNEAKYLPSSSPDMRPQDEDIYDHPRLQIPDLPQQPHHAAALQLILQAQQQKQQQLQQHQQQQPVELLQPFLRLSALSQLPGRQL